MSANVIVAGNLLHGAATVIKVGNADIGGTTEAGVQVKAEPEWFKHFVDQAKSPVKLTLMGREFMVDMELADLRMTNMLIALNEPAAKLSGCCLTLDDSADDGGTLEITGPGPSPQARTFYFDNAMVMSGINYGMMKKQPSAMQLTFNCLYNSGTTRNGYMLDAAA